MAAQGDSITSFEKQQNQPDQYKKGHECRNSSIKNWNHNHILQITKSKETEIIKAINNNEKETDHFT